MRDGDGNESVALDVCYRGQTTLEMCLLENRYILPECRQATPRLKLWDLLRHCEEDKGRHDERRNDVDRRAFPR